VRDLVDLVWSLPQDGSRYAAVFDLMGFAGLRPSEVSGVEVNDLRLPSDGWGIVRLGRAVTSPGERYAREANAYETKELKHRASGDIREVPIPPETVTRLRRHMDRFSPHDGRVFLNADGNPVSSNAYSRVFKRAKAQLWPEGHKLAKVVPYDLRHSAATIMLRAGVPPAEVAIRLGHSVDMLMKVYAGVFDGERERSNALIDAELDASGRD
jgi:integrase